MLIPFMKNDVFIVFSDKPSTGGPACRVLGPYHEIRFGAKGIGGWKNDGSEPSRIATQAIDSLCWEVDGLDDLLWGTTKIISPPSGTTARAIEAANDLIR